MGKLVKLAIVCNNYAATETDLTIKMYQFTIYVILKHNLFAQLYVNQLTLQDAACLLHAFCSL